MRTTGRTRAAGRRGFTLVELMMVIAIIAVLTGLTLTGINAGVKSIKRRAIAMEVLSLAQAVEAYKLKYGEYPPDGSNRAAFEAHFKGAFPNIVATEFAALYSVANSNSQSGVMDPAEVLVFCLGGFSNDPTRPFTGPGGPLSDAGNGFQYNSDRTKGTFDFAQDRLTLTVTGSVTVSNDEIVLGTMFENERRIDQSDALPVYSPRGLRAPYVYFASSTYSFPIVGSYYFNHYKADNVGGVARPYKSNQLNTNVQPTSLVNREKHYKYANDKSFQIVSAGLDDDYGGVRSLDYQDSTPVFFVFPTGGTLDVAGSGPKADSGYVNPSGGPSAQLDNVTNFSEGTLESTLP